MTKNLTELKKTCDVFGSGEKKNDKSKPWLPFKLNTQQILYPTFLVSITYLGPIALFAFHVSKHQLKTCTHQKPSSAL